MSLTASMGTREQTITLSVSALFLHYCTPSHVSINKNKVQLHVSTSSVSHIKGGTQTAGVSEQPAGEYILGPIVLLGKQYYTDQMVMERACSKHGREVCENHIMDLKYVDGRMCVGFTCPNG
jgi:hypothetical protein